MDLRRVEEKCLSGSVATILGFFAQDANGARTHAVQRQQLLLVDGQ
jgi:hypothetical protein